MPIGEITICLSRMTIDMIVCNQWLLQLKFLIDFLLILQTYTNLSAFFILYPLGTEPESQRERGRGIESASLG